MSNSESGALQVSSVRSTESFHVTSDVSDDDNAPQQQDPRQSTDRDDAIQRDATDAAAQSILTVQTAMSVVKASNQSLFPATKCSLVGLCITEG